MVRFNTSPSSKAFNGGGAPALMRMPGNQGGTAGLFQTTAVAGMGDDTTQIEYDAKNEDGIDVIDFKIGENKDVIESKLVDLRTQ